ncbi:MAG: hypothetical protein ABI353_00205 [Isosphaeraceae bacterium]
MTAVLCHNATDRSAETWKAQIAPFTSLEFAVSDAAKGIASALDRTAKDRRAAGDATPLSQGLDLFHTAREAHTVLTRAWRRAEAVWAKAEALDAEVAELQRRGINAQGRGQTRTVAWRHAIAAFEAADRQDTAWRRARAALDRFTPDGRLNDRRRAESEIDAAVSDLMGEPWKTVRNFVRDRRSTAFLDRMHERLAVAEPRREWREAMAWRWWGRHGDPSASADARVELIRSLGWGRPLNEAETASYTRVSAVLSSTVRASSAVECLNSVLRMQQSCHKRMTQAMLDLKRLYWNCHRLKAGKRQGFCPYEHLGLSLPNSNFWTVLQTDPEQLTQTLSGQKDAP